MGGKINIATLGPWRRIFSELALSGNKSFEYVTFFVFYVKCSIFFFLFFSLCCRLLFFVHCIQQQSVEKLSRKHSADDISKSSKWSERGLCMHACMYVWQPSGGIGSKRKGKARIISCRVVEGQWPPGYRLLGWIANSNIPRPPPGCKTWFSLRKRFFFVCALDLS